MGWEAWLTAAVVVVTIVLLAWDFTAPAGVMLGSVVVLLVTDVVEPSEALAGFGNPAPVTVAALYVVAAGMERTGLVNRMVEGVLGGSSGERSSLTRLVVPSGVASAFVNNTPIVAMVAPAVGRWAQRVGRPASRVLMPLSFAAILGGMATVIGTSTHIVVSGLLEETGLEPFGFFEVATLGLPVALVGFVLLVLLAPAVLPDRRSARRDIEDSREYTVEMTVAPGGPIDGIDVERASLRHLVGVFLVQVERNGETMSPVGPDFVLRGGDVLRFVGNAREAADLQDRTGLSPVTDPRGVIRGPMAFFEAVVGVGSMLVGRSLRDIGFRERYQAAVLAIHRADQRVLGKLGDARLRVGDTLLVIATPGFRSAWSGAGDFLVVSRLDAPDPSRVEKQVPAALAGLFTIVLAATGVVSILEAALIGAFAIVLTGVLSPQEARRAIDLNVVVLIAASFGVGNAIAVSGLATSIAEAALDGLSGAAPIVVLVGVAVGTIVLTEAVTNNGAAVLVFPIGLAVASELGVDPRAFAVTISIAASASFLTPIGYQTNTMVWGPGGYRFGDYSRLGAPLTLLTLVVVAVAAPMWWTL